METNELSRSRRHAEEDARYKAMTEYYKPKKVEYYLRNTEHLQKTWRMNEKVQIFFGHAELNLSQAVSEQFHRGLKRYRQKT